jgi:hypothetical protein
MAMMATKPMEIARNAMQTTPIKEAVKRRNRNKVKDPEMPEVEAGAGRKTAGETAEESNHRTATGTRSRPRPRTVAPRKSPLSHVPSTSSIRSATIAVVVSG